MIKIRHLWKSYGSNVVLKDVSLDILKGETLVILGRSGVGKSVLLKHIIGIEKPEKGWVEVDGVCISKLRGTELYENIKHMGMLFQGGALFDSLTVEENTAFYLRQHPEAVEEPLTEAEILDRVAHALEMVDMAGTQDKMPSDLSGGMRKRAALARLIVYRPKILLYDEPTTGLDPITAMQINELILKIQEELQATSVVVTHDIPSAIKVGDRLALQHDGRIAVIAPKDEFLLNENKVIQSFLNNALPGRKGS